MLFKLIIGPLVVVFLAYVAELARSYGDDPREPRRLRPRVPLIGHILGLLRHGPAYYTLTNSRTDDRIYTVDLLNVKMYITNDVHLLPLITKAHKTVSFSPFLKVAAERIAGNSKPACDLFDGLLLQDYSHSIKTALSPGEILDAINVRTGQASVLEIDSIVNDGEGKRIRLLDWVRHIVIQASSNGMFGTEHPFRDRTVEKAFWEWQTHLPSHMTGLDLLGKADKAREIVHKSVRSYCSGMPPDASEAVHERHRVLRESGMSFEDAIKQESSFCVAVFGNTAPTMFWTIYELFSRPGLLAEVRDEIAANAVTEIARTCEGVEMPQFALDVAALKTKCPLLLSSYQEIQRTRDIHANIRKVLTDTFLDDGRYLLRKGNYCIVPGPSIHKSTRAWGESATAFDPYRFITKNARKYGQSGQKFATPPPSSFLAWGTPPHLCPARQFATTEIFVIVALLIMRVDLVPTEKNGKWEKNPALNTGHIVSLPNPREDIEVEVKLRETASGKWIINMGESKTRIALASG
ncbi:cytochrome P450 [Xylaria sp. FL0043]|nr:cytochrome P450 [Xylaria sp. FL0043]